jgi:hypothetical protein
MDQADASATYAMSPRRVVFEYRANGEARSAAISGDALERLVGGKDLAGPAQHLAAYQAHWAAIHGVAATKYEQGYQPVVRVGDLQGR